MGPPYWVWAESCDNLAKINLSCNMDLTTSFINGYFEELLQYTSLATEIIIFNCRLKNHIKFLSTFPKARILRAGTQELSNGAHSNIIEDLPCMGIDKLCDIEILELSNTSICNISPSIIMFKNLIEINLSLNKLASLPEGFCSLENLEVCILSFNHLLYLPESFHKLEKLKTLCINSNSLCMLPENLCQLQHLRKLDLYDNYLYEGPDNIYNLEEIDLAQNYFDEPLNEEYQLKKEKIRSKSCERYDGRKVEINESESEHTTSEIDDEELLKSLNNEEEVIERPLSSPEDWDSDDYWVPYFTPQTKPIQSPWLYFIQQKMDEGNFCPIDAHAVPVDEKVKYEKLCNPKIEYESDGQFDDISGDDS